MTGLDILDCRANLISEFPPLGGIVNLKVCSLLLFTVNQVSSV